MEQNDSKRVLKRVNIEQKLNKKLTSMAKNKSMNHDEFINAAIEHYINYEEGNVQEENIYTLRLNEIIQTLNLLRSENSSNNQSIKHRLDTIFEIYDTSNYLNE